MLAITHIPSPRMQACERTFVELAEIDLDRARSQHAEYCRALRQLGLGVRTLDVNGRFPDGVFIEDTAVVLDEVAILASMGTQSRREEPFGIEPVLREYRSVERIALPATLEGGDVLRIGKMLLVGRSPRTNDLGISALSMRVSPFGYEVRPVPVRGCLHLKTGCTALPDGRLLVNPDWIDVGALAGWELVPVPKSEPWGANICLVGARVLASAAHTNTTELIHCLGFEVQTVDLSEFAKAEGGVTCLSLFIP